MKDNDYVSWLGSVFGTIFTTVQPDEVFRYISLGLTILSTLVAILYTIWKWWRKAKEDGKISSDEIKELKDDITDIIGKKGESKDD